MALALVALVASGLLFRSFDRLRAVKPGFDPNGVVTLWVAAPPVRYPQQTDVDRFHSNLLERVRALPGVRSATLAYSIPLTDCCSLRGTRIEGYAARPGESTEINWNVVATDYFRTLGIPLVQGRAFEQRDRDGAPPVVIVSEAFARRYLPGQAVLGRRIFLNGPDSPAAEVVGVVRDGKYRSLGEEPLPFFYAPLAQQYRSAMTLEVRTAGDPGAMLPLLRGRVRELAPTLPVIRPTTMREALGVALLSQRLGALLLGALGAIAGLLAALGLYGKRQNQGFGRSPMP